MRCILAGTMIVTLSLGAACQSGGAKAREASPPPRPQLFDGMGGHRRAVTTSSPEAQRWFDQGLTWMYSFNHDEAIRSFQEAARIDPRCAMAQWGVAICNGPHINLPVMDDVRDARAWEALGRAMNLRTGASPVERSLIEALSARYASPPPKDRAHLDRAYADAMRRVWRENPRDADVATLCAESIMDLHPWDLWTVDGSPKEDAEEVVATLEAAMRLNPKHPGANHLYIHAVEASTAPERANAAADFLRTAVPASGHMVHMPSHIDIRTGRWTLAAQMNERAMEADSAYRALVPRQGFYTMYMTHDPQFLCFVSMMEGRNAAALTAARDAVNGIPKDFLEANAPIADAFVHLPYSALMRFGRWEEILREPEPRSDLPVSRAMRRYARAAAFAAQGRLDEAERERRAFRAAVKRVPPDAMLMINRAHDVLAIADHVLDGEIAYRRGDHDGSIAALREAARLEDKLLYMEPPEWIQPVRHTLGAVLVDAGRFSEAQEVYREDLRRWPENGWSLYGLGRCLDGLGETAEAARVKQRFEAAWARADTPIRSTCLCVQSAALSVK